MRILTARKKFKSRRIHFLHKMAAATAIFSLTFFCTFLLKVRSVPANMAIVPLSVNPGKMLSNANSNLRHHRILHFTNEQEDTRHYGYQNRFKKDTKDDLSERGTVFVFPMHAGEDNVNSINKNTKSALEDYFAEENLSSLGNGASVQSQDGRNNNINNNNFSKDSNEKSYDRDLSENSLPISDGRNSHLDVASHHSKKSLVVPNRNADLRNTSEIPIQRLPQAIIIGVKKSGTRALLEFLRIHPDVEGTGPEPHFFDRNYDKGLEWYRSLMPKTYKGQITLEKTPSYFITKEVPRRIYKMNPEVKLILVVRDPVTRAISDYCQAASKRPVRSFEDMALLSERKGLVNTSWNAIKIGVYAKHIQKWLRTFRRDQIHLVDGQTLITEPAKELAKAEEFLGLPKFINETHFYLNAFKGTFPCLVRRGRKHCLDEKTKGRDHPKVRESVIQRLQDFYRPFNAKFYEIVGRDFGWPV